MHDINEEKYETCGDNRSQNQGVLPLLHSDFVHQIVDGRIFLWNWISLFIPSSQTRTCHVMHSLVDGAESGSLGMEAFSHGHCNAYLVIQQPITAEHSWIRELMLNQLANALVLPHQVIRGPAPVVHCE